jgi:hypothetical protein
MPSGAPSSDTGGASFCLTETRVALGRTQRRSRRVPSSPCAKSCLCGRDAWALCLEAVKERDRRPLRLAWTRPKLADV